MDYYSLTRKELQALCKKYAIPANLTNVSMAEALTALLNAENNKPPDEAFQKQDAASENMGEESVLTEVSNIPKGSTRLKRNGVVAEGKSVEDPILLDDEETPLALKEKNVKSAPKNPRGKGGDPTGKSRTRGLPGKILDEDELTNVNGLSDVITPHASVKLQRDRTCKSGRMRSRHPTSSKDAKPLQVKQDSCEKEEESDEANESVEEVPKEKPNRRSSRKKVDKVETEGSIQGPIDTNDEAVEEVLKLKPKPRSSRRKIDEVEEATEESIQGADGTNDESVEQFHKTGLKGRSSRKKFGEVKEAAEESIQETINANDESVEVPKTRPKARLSRKRVYKVEEATEESVETDDPNDDTVKEVPESRPKEIHKTRPKGRSSRKKFDEVKGVAEESIQGSIDANDESVEVPKSRPKARSRKRVDKVEEATEESTGTDDKNDESDEVPENRPKETTSRKKDDEVEEATDKTVQETDYVYNESVEEVPENSLKERPSRRTGDANYESVKVQKTRSSKKQVDDAEEVTEESIQGVDYKSKGDLTQTCRRSTREDALKGLDTQPLVTRSSSRRNASGVDSVWKIPGTSKRLSASSKGKLAANVEDSSGKKVENDPAETSVKVSAKINMKTPVQTLSAMSSSKEDSTKLHNRDILEASTIKVKQASTCQQRNPIQNLHHLAVLQNEKDSSCDLDCSDSKQDRAGNKRSARKETSKSQGKYAEELGILEADIDSKENKDTFKDDVTKKIEASKEVESEEVKYGILEHQKLKACQILDEKQMPCNVSQEERTKQVKKESMVEISPKKSSESLGSPISGRVDSISVCTGESILEQHEVMMNTNVIDGIMMSREHSVTLEIQESSVLKSHSKCLPAEGSAMKNNSFTNSTHVQEGEARSIKVEESWEKTIDEDVNIAESYSGYESETMHKDLEVDENAAFYHGMDSRDAKKGKVHCNEDEESKEKTAQDDLIIAERTEPETMHLDSEADGSDIALKGEAPGIKDEESQGKVIQEGVGISENNCGTELETMHEDLEITENVAFSHGVCFRDITQITIDAQDDGEDHCIEDEPEKTVRGCSQEGFGISESHSGTEPENVHEDLEVTENTAFSHDILSRGIAQSTVGDCSQGGVGISESCSGTEPETTHEDLEVTENTAFSHCMHSNIAKNPIVAQEAEDHCIEDKDNLEKTLRDGSQEAEDCCIEDNLEETVEDGSQDGEDHCIEDKDNLEETVEDGPQDCPQDSVEHCIEDKDNLEKTVEDGSHDCPQDSEDHCIEDKDYLEKTVEDGSHDCPQDSEDHCIEDEDYLEDNVEDDLQDGSDHCIEDEDYLEDNVEDGLQDGRDHCIEDEDYLEDNVEDGLQDGRDHCIEGEDHCIGDEDYLEDNVEDGLQDGRDHRIEGEDHCIGDEDYLEDNVEEDGEDHCIGDEDYLEDNVEEDGEDHCIEDEDHFSEDEDNLEKTVADGSQDCGHHCIDYFADEITEPDKTTHSYLKAHDQATFSHDIVSRNVAQICMPFNEGEAPLIKYEESRGNIGVEPEFVHADNVVAPGIKDEESPGKTLQEGVSIFESHNPTEPETIHAALVDENAESACIEKSKEIIIASEAEIASEAQIEKWVAPSGQIDSEVQPETRVASASAQVDIHVQTSKRLTSSSAQIDSEVQPETRVASSSAKIASIGDFVPLTPPKEEKHILVPISVEQEISVAPQSLGNTDEVSEEMSILEALRTTNSLVEDIGVGDKNPLAVQKSEQNNKEVFENMVCMEDTHFHEKTCGSDEEVQVEAYGDKLQNEADNNSLLIEMEQSPCLNDHLSKLYALYKEKKAKVFVPVKDAPFNEKTFYRDEEVQVTCVNKLRNEVDYNSLQIEKEKKAKVTATVKDTHFNEKTCVPDEGEQVTCVNKLQNDYNSLQIEKENKAMVSVPVKDTHFNKKTCVRDEEKVKLKNDYNSLHIEKENCSYLNDLSLRKLRALLKEKKAKQGGKRSALNTLSSNELEERESAKQKD